MMVTRETADGEQNRLVDERADRAADDQGGRDEREALRVRDEQEEQLDLLWHSWRSERNSASADDKGKTKCWVGPKKTFSLFSKNQISFCWPTY